MTRRLSGWLLIFSLGAPVALRAADPWNDLASATIVVFNRVAPDSAKLARFYAEQRNIPNDHLVGLDCSLEEEISRQEYDATIAEPLRKIFSERKWWTLRSNAEDHPVASTNSIHFVALIRGMPLKIRPATDYPGDQVGIVPAGGQNAASVDSELVMLGAFSRQISGPATNPYFQSYRPIVELNDPALMLVCRLDAPTPEIVRRMITDAIETEKSGLWGRAYVDGANNTAGGLADGDEWLQTVVKDLRRVGIPVVYDGEPATFPPGYPMNDCILYYGWYAGGVSGSFSDSDFAFARGAVAVHIHSFSANTLRDANANWVAPLLSKGAAASLGNVYEPFLQLTAHLDIFDDRLLHGFTFAESAYMATRGLSWMGIAVGDPLYRPYASWLQLEAKRDTRKKSDWRMYHEFAQKNAAQNPPDYLTLARQAASRAGNGPMIEDLGLLEKANGNFVSAISYFQQARSLYTKRDDILRVVLEQADALIKADKKKAALALVRSVTRVVPDAPASALLRKIEQQLNSPGSLTPSRSP